MPFNSDSSFWSYLNPRQGYRTAEKYRRYLGRMRDVPRYFDEHIVNMRAGLERGFSVPRVTLEGRDASLRSEEHTSELQSLMRISYAVFCLTKKKTYTEHTAVQCTSTTEAATL